MFKKITDSPKNLFLLDAGGALLSSFLLGVVLVHFESFFGIPAKVLYVLAALPIFFAIYDICCYFGAESGVFLKGISVMNSLYCVLSIVLAFLHSETITYLGWLYIIVEILVVLGLAAAQFKVASTFARK